MTSVESTDLLLPDDTRLLHIGPQKTGSTALQAAVHHNRDAIRSHGVTALGTERRDRQALWAMLMHHDSTEERYRRDFTRWESLVGEMDAADGRAFLSNESLGKADLDGAHRMVAALGGDRAHVVAVARRLDRLLPSQWQQRVQMHGTTLPYEQWLEVVLGNHPDDPVWRNIWVPHDVEGLVGRWTDAADPDRFTLVVADESDRQMLSRTFEAMLGLPGGMLRPQEAHKTNASLSYGRLEVVRLLNAYLDRREWPEDVTSSGPASLQTRVRRAVKLAAPAPGEQRVPGLPDWARERVAELSDARAGLVSSLGVRVIGDPAHLRLPDAEQELSDVAAEPAVVTAELTARVIAQTIEAALDRERDLLASRDVQIAKLRRRVRALRRDGVGGAGTSGALTSRLTRLRGRLPF